MNLSVDAYAAVLRQFRSLWTEIGERPFYLTWHCLSGYGMRVSGSPLGGTGQILEWLDSCKKEQPFDLDEREVIGRLRMPHDEHLESFSLGFDVVTLPKAETYRSPRNDFLELCRDAGSFLPSVIRNPLYGFVSELNPDAASWWLALLFFMNGEAISNSQGGETSYRKEITIYQPLLLSIETIERLKLNTDQPEWPHPHIPDVGEREAGDKEPPRDQVRLVVEKWSDLLICIHENGKFYADSLAELEEGPFVLGKATELHLPGNHWEELLRLFADSEDGRTALKKDLLEKWKYVDRSPKEEEFAEFAANKEKMTIMKDATRKLSVATGDFSRKLREQICAMDDEKGLNPPISAKKEKTVRASFTVVVLLRNQEDKLQIKWPRKRA